MNDFQGLIFAYFTNPNLRELINVRTAASLPFCGRYRLIDFSLSAMRNAGIYDVGVIMQRDYPPSVCPSATAATTPAPWKP